MVAKTGFGKDTADRLVIDAGVIFKNVTFNPSTGEFNGDLLGATTGGVEIKMEKKFRKIEVDGGYMMDVKGLEVVESAGATVKTTLLELSADNLRLAMGGQKTNNSQYNGYTVIEDKFTVEDSDYINNMAVFGKITGSNKPIIVMFDNVLITSAFEVKMEDKKEVGLEIEGTAHASYDQLQNLQSPYRVIYPDDAGSKSASTTSNTSSVTGGTSSVSK